MKLIYLIISATMIGTTILIGYKTLNTVGSDKLIGIGILLVLLTLFFISFVISLDQQEKRQKLHIAELSTSQKTDTQQRKGTLYTVIIVIALGITYFLIGKQAQQPPEIIPDSYFETTWLNPNLPDEENGYIQFGELFGTTRTDTETQKLIEEKYPYTKLEMGERNTEGYRTSNKRERNDEGVATYKQYETFTEMMDTKPEYLNTIETLENSDFFEQLERLTQLQRQDNEMFLPILQIQAISRSLRSLAAYSIEQGNYEKALNYNILQLKLADKYLTSHASIIQELI
jgi:preprotein translocase subunit YajC